MSESPNTSENSNTITQPWNDAKNKIIKDYMSDEIKSKIAETIEVLGPLFKGKFTINKDGQSNYDINDNKYPIFCNAGTNRDVVEYEDDLLVKISKKDGNSNIVELANIVSSQTLRKSSAINGWGIDQEGEIITFHTKINKFAIPTGDYALQYKDSAGITGNIAQIEKIFTNNYLFEDLNPIKYTGVAIRNFSSKTDFFKTKEEIEQAKQEYIKGLGLETEEQLHQLIEVIKEAQDRKIFDISAFRTRGDGTSQYGISDEGNIVVLDLGMGNTKEYGSAIGYITAGMKTLSDTDISKLVV